MTARTLLIGQIARKWLIYKMGGRGGPHTFSLLLLLLLSYAHGHAPAFAHAPALAPAVAGATDVASDDDDAPATGLVALDFSS